MPNITINTKGRFNYRTLHVTTGIFEALKGRDYVKTAQPFLGEPVHSVELENDSSYHELIKAINIIKEGNR